MRFRAALIGVGLVALMVRLFAQAPAANLPSFDVASIKPTAGPPQGPSAPVSADRFRVRWYTLSMLVSLAYQTRTERIIGGPAWVRSDRFDIEATTGSAATPAQKMQMLQRLLAERFKLVVHHEEPQQPIYVLSVARSDRQLGRSLHPSTFDCETRPSDGSSVTPPPADHPFGCTPHFCLGTFAGDGLSTGHLAFMLENVVSRPVVDRTDLSGRFDVDLRWAPDSLPGGRGAAGAPPVDPDAPSFFTAVQEQLGLKLESTTGPVDVLVIDRVERPTAD